MFVEEEKVEVCGDHTPSSIPKCMVLKEKKYHRFCINITNICLILFSLLFVAKDVYN